MTEQEIIGLQAKGGKRYLAQMGSFVHAYEGAAFAMARLTGYGIRVEHRKAGDMRILGFGVAQMESVAGRLKEAGIILQPEGEGLWSFLGGDATEDAALISAPKAARKGKAEQTAGKSLLDELLGCNLADFTPMQAMNFLSDLQRRYGKK